MSADNSMNAWQQDALARFRDQQQAYLDAVAAWRKAFQAGTTGGAAPTPPTGPSGGGPGPGDLLEANRAFIEGLLKQQQEFLENLTRALNGNS